MLPTAVKLEACSLCQLNCRSCWIRLHNNFSLGHGYLKFVDFERFLKLNPYIKEIELSDSGEIFLNPELGAIIEHAFNNGVKLFANNGVNFNNVSPRILESLVKYQFEGFVVSIDGWDQASYSWYRKGGSFDAVIKNLKLLNQFKAKYNSWRPRITWKYIIFEGNDNEAGAKIAQDMAKELNMDFHFAKDGCGYEPKNIRSDDPSKSVFRGWNIPCSQLWLAPRINYDGRFFGCCENNEYAYETGSLFDIPLAEYLESKPVRDTKLMLMGKKCGANPACERCKYYKLMQDSGNFISDEELKNHVRLVE